MRNVFQALARPLTARVSVSAVWLGVALLLLAVVVATAPVAAADDAASPVQDRQVVHRSPSSSSAGASSRGSASATRGSVSQGAGRTRPGGSGGERGVAQRPSGSGRSGYHPSPGSNHHHHGYYPYFGGPSFRYYGYFGFGYYGFPFYRPYSSPYYSPYYYPPAWYYSPVYPTLGALDLNVKPKRAEVYVDGYWVGPVSAFDGYPGYLWLEKGTHDLVIYLEGYATFHQVVEVRPGVVIRLRERMLAGVATPPEEIVPPPPRAAEQSEPSEAAAPSPAPGPAVSLGTEPGRLHLTVEPQDASVYLDGRFLGTGQELVGLRAGLMVNPGSHRVSVVRPSYAAEELEIEVVAGKDLDLAIHLEPAG